MSAIAIEEMRSGQSESRGPQRHGLSVRDASAYNSFPGRHWLVVLKSYLDGSGKSHDAQCRFLTLVGYAAPPDLWPAFEVRWEAILTKHNEKYIHMNEDRYRQRPVLHGELLDLIEKATPCGMTVVSSSLDLEAHKSLSSDLRLPSPGRICAEFCIDQLLLQADSISCFFDRGEEFYKAIAPGWNSEECEEWPQLFRVHELSQVRMNYYPGVQAADILAWYTNRTLTKSDYDIEFALVANRTPIVSKLFDHETLVQKYGITPQKEIDQ